MFQTPTYRLAQSYITLAIYFIIHAYTTYIATPMCYINDPNTKTNKLTMLSTDRNLCAAKVFSTDARSNNLQVEMLPKFHINLPQPPTIEDKTS